MGRRRRSLLNSSTDQSGHETAPSDGFDGADLPDDLDATLDTGSDAPHGDDELPAADATAEPEASSDVPAEAQGTNEEAPAEAAPADTALADAAPTGAAADAARADEAPAEADAAAPDAAPATERPKPDLSRPEQPVSAPDAARDMAQAEKSDEPAPDEIFAKNVATANPAIPRETAPAEELKDTEDDDDWFLRTGQPAPSREMANLEEDEDSVIAPPPASALPDQNYVVVLGLLAAAGALGVVGILLVLLLT